MYQINSKVWAIIHIFDTPKEVVIEELYHHQTNSGTQSSYVVKYKNRTYEIKNEDVYPTQMDAEIYWAVLVREDYEATLELPDLFSTDEYEIANSKAEKIIKKYANSHPHLILKYF